jgi:hypothetical protein
MWNDLSHKRCRPKQVFFAGQAGQFITCPQCRQEFLSERSLYSDSVVVIPTHYDLSYTRNHVRRYSHRVPSTAIGRGYRTES